MDDKLIAKVGDEQVIRTPGHGSSEIELLPHKGTDASERYTLKTLPELYGAGTGMESADTLDTRFQPLLMAIEEAIVEFDMGGRGATDGLVLTSLDRLCMTPESDVRNDVLASAIQTSIRLILSLNDYSRQDVKHALRKVKQSVNRHNKLGGPRGYLTFIRPFIRPSGPRRHV